MKFLKLFCLSIWFFLTLPASSETVNNIEINGNITVSKGTILSYIPIEIGDDFNDSISDLLIKTLFKSELFEDIKLVFKDGALSITVKESPVISYFEVNGYKNDRVLNENNLKLAIDDLKLSSGNILVKSSLEKFMRSLNKEYQDSGFYKAQKF